MQLPGNNQIKSVSTGGPQELLDLIPCMHLLPGEIEADLEDLREAFLSELAPTTPYETAIAENIIALEWETHRYRGLRDNLIRSSIREFAIGTRESGKVERSLGFGSSSEEGEAFADALMSPTQDDAAEANAWLADYNINIGEIVAAAYQQVSRALDPHERKLAELETRRRRLRQDYDQLKGARAHPIADAEIVDPQ